MRLVGRHAVVTGGGTGIGAAIACALAAEGAKLTLVGRRREKLEVAASHLRSSRAKSRDRFELSRELGDLSGAGERVSTSLDMRGVFCVQADITQQAEVSDGFAEARNALGPIAILVNNAGAAQGAPFGKISEQLWRDMLAVNLDGVFHCSQAALPDLLADPAGRIVTVASMAGLHGFAYAAPYIAAKHGAVGLTRALAVEYARTNLRVNAVCPGFVDTDMTVASVANIQAKTGRSEDAARSELAALNPSGRLIAPGEVADAVLDLICSERNGETVEIA